MLDSGHHADLQIARFLPDEEDITVVTNDFDVLGVLNQEAEDQDRHAGRRAAPPRHGRLRRQTVAALDDLLLDKLFLGVDGFDVEARHHHAPRTPRPS